MNVCAIASSARNYCHPDSFHGAAAYAAETVSIRCGSLRDARSRVRDCYLHRQIPAVSDFSLLTVWLGPSSFRASRMPSIAMPYCAQRGWVLLLVVVLWVIRKIFDGRKGVPLPVDESNCPDAKKAGAWAQPLLFAVCRQLIAASVDCARRASSQPVWRPQPEGRRTRPT